MTLRLRLWGWLGREHRELGFLQRISEPSGQQAHFAAGMKGPASAQDPWLSILPLPLIDI